MKLVDIALLAVLAVVVFFALRKTLRSRGGCNCGSAGCSGNCPACGCGRPDCPAKRNREQREAQ